VLSLLTNPITKYLIIGGIILLGLTYFQFRINELETELSQVKKDLIQSKSNLNVCIITNTSNNNIIEEYKKDINSFKEDYNNIILHKDKVIKHLRLTILNLKKPIIYPKEYIYKECKIQIKEEFDENSTGNIISNIGF